MRKFNSLDLRLTRDFLRVITVGRVILKVFAFIAMTVVGVTAGAIFADYNGIPKGGLPGIIGLVFGAGAWLLVAKLQKPKD